MILNILLQFHFIDYLQIECYFAILIQAELALIADSKKEVNSEQKKNKKKKKFKKEAAKIQKDDSFKVSCYKFIYMVF